MLSDVYFPRVNGVSTSIRTTAFELARRGHAVTLVAPDYGAQDDAGLPFEVTRLPACSLFFDPEDRLIRGTAIAPAAIELAQRRWDVIHVHTPFRAHRLGTMVARATGCRCVETFHTHFEDYAAHYLPWLPAALLRFAVRRFARRMCGEIDHLIAPSPQIVELLERYGIDTPRTVIPTGIDLTEFTGGDGARFRAQHDVDPARAVIVTVSRLAVEKNVAFLLDVARELVDEFPDLLFMIAGEGPDAERLKARGLALGLDVNVRFFGNLDRRTTLLDCYRAGDAFVFASPTETQGLVLIEAMALGVPIVSTAELGTVSVLANARGAVIAPPDVPTFARRVAELLRSRALRAQLSIRAREDARAWSASEKVAEVLRLYEALRREWPDANAPLAGTAES